MKVERLQWPRKNTVKPFRRSRKRTVPENYVPYVCSTDQYGSWKTSCAIVLEIGLPRPMQPRDWYKQCPRQQKSIQPMQDSVLGPPRCLKLRYIYYHLQHQSLLPVRLFPGCHSQTRSPRRRSGYVKSSRSKIYLHGIIGICSMLFEGCDSSEFGKPANHPVQYFGRSVPNVI